MFLPLACHRCFHRCLHRCFRLALHREERAPLMAIACPVFSSFSLGERQLIETRTFHRFAVCKPSDHHCCFQTPLCSPTLATTRSRPERLPSTACLCGARRQAQTGTDRRNGDTSELAQRPLLDVQRTDHRHAIHRLPLLTPGVLGILHRGFPGQATGCPDRKPHPSRTQSQRSESVGLCHCSPD